MDKKDILKDKDKKNIEQTADKAIRGLSTKKKEPNVVQNGTINIANYGSGDINFIGLSLKELTELFGELTPVSDKKKPFSIYKAANLPDFHFIFDNELKCVGSVNEPYVKELKDKIKKRDAIIREQKKQIALLKDEVKFLRTKIK